MEEQVTLRAGDYVAIKDIDSPEQATAIADAFMEAGAKPGAGYPYADDGDGWDNLFWDGGDNTTNRGSGGIRRLMPFQVLGEPVTLRPGDYVSTEGMTEDQYRAVEKAFLHAGGRSDGDHGFEKYVKGGSSSFLGWDKRSGEMWDCGHCAMGFSRHLTPAQVIGAVNAGSQQGEAVSDTLTQTLRDAADHDEKANHHAAEHDRLMQQARDMLPDGWRLVRDEDMDY